MNPGETIGSAGDSCADCLMWLPPDIDAFADGRAPCPSCGSVRRHVSLGADLVGVGTLQTRNTDAHRELTDVDIARVSHLAGSWRDTTVPLECPTRTLRETRFTIRVAHPEETGETWMVVIENEDRDILDWGLGDSLDEALLSCVDTIVYFDFE